MASENSNPQFATAVLDALTGGPAVEVTESAPAEVAPPGTPYSHEAMVELMIRHPDWTHGEFAAAFGRKPSWFASVLASEGFQAALDPHRHRIADPSLTATMDERMRALALQSLTVLQTKLEGKEVLDLTVLKAVEIGTKALGMGQAQALPAPTAAPVGVDSLADRLVQALERQRKNIPAADVVDVTAKAAPGGA